MSIVVEIKGLYKYFGRHEVLRGIDLKVEKGDVLFLCGPSGAGKSTLLRCVNGLETFQKGEIGVLGKDISSGRSVLREVRKRTGMVFQHFNLFPHMTVLQNITLGPIKALGLKRQDAELKAQALLQQVGLSDKADAWPNHLSGGQKQRVAIARSLAMEPDLMLFDEPTSALDPEMIKEVLEVMQELARMGMTMIIVSHEMGFAKEAATKVAFLDQGVILEIAESKKFFSAPEHPRTLEFLGKIL